MRKVGYESVPLEKLAKGVFKLGASNFQLKYKKTEVEFEVMVRPSRKKDFMRKLKSSEDGFYDFEQWLKGLKASE